MVSIMKSLQKSLQNNSLDSPTSPSVGLALKGPGRIHARTNTLTVTSDMEISNSVNKPWEQSFS